MTGRLHKIFTILSLLVSVATLLVAILVWWRVNESLQQVRDPQKAITFQQKVDDTRAAFPGPVTLFGPCDKATSIRCGVCPSASADPEWALMTSITGTVTVAPDGTLVYPDMSRLFPSGLDVAPGTYYWCPDR